MDLSPVSCSLLLLFSGSQLAAFQQRLLEPRVCLCDSEIRDRYLLAVHEGTSVKCVAADLSCASFSGKQDINRVSLSTYFAVIALYFALLVRALCRRFGNRFSSQGQ
jgi:hypothetical protein